MPRVGATQQSPDDEWQLVKHAIGIGSGWEAAYRLVSTLDPSGAEFPANLTP
jgi:hypothetical protein